VIERRVSPRAVDSRVVLWNDDHIVWGRSTSGNGQLLVVLPGTSDVPENYRLFGATAASLGYRVISLMYADNLAVVTECSSDTDPQCMEKMRKEIVDGEAVSPHVSVDEPNSIVGRLTALVRYLAREFPNEGWSAFVNDAGLEWAKVAVSGLSQGGGHAAYIAREHSVPRAILFGAPADGYGGQPAPWMQLGATPANRYFGFRHTRDPFTSITPNWLALGMDAFGPGKTITRSTTDFSGSHMLLTDELPATGSYDGSHPSVIHDFFTPRTGSSAAFVVAWRYLLGAS
jgi:hypothetical protein